MEKLKCHHREYQAWEGPQHWLIHSLCATEPASRTLQLTCDPGTGTVCYYATGVLLIV